MVDTQAILGEAISNPAFCDQPAVSPEAILREAGVDSSPRKYREADRWGLLDSPPIISRRRLLRSRQRDSFLRRVEQPIGRLELLVVIHFIGGTQVWYFCRLLTASYYYRALCVLASLHRSRA